LIHHFTATDVTRGLDPRVHPFFAIAYCVFAVFFAKQMDARVKPAHDNLMKSRSGAMLRHRNQPPPPPPNPKNERC
jgi:hypothetical protein